MWYALYNLSKFSLSDKKIKLLDNLKPSRKFLSLTLFPLRGGHGVSLHIQIISFQIWIELWVYENIISSLLHIWEEWVLQFIIKNLKNFEFENM